MLNQRLRNLTTGRLHTSIDDVYEDIGYITGSPGIMTRTIPRAMTSMKPWLQAKVLDPRFWDGAHDTSHNGETEIEPMTPDEKAAFFDFYKTLPSPFDGKRVEVVVVP